MHELSVCLALMKQVERVAADHGALSVECIRLQIGPLSGVEPALLKKAFTLAAAGTVADAALLKIDTGPVVVRCTRCDTETEVKPNRLLCGQCGDFRTRVIRGEEMLLQSLDLDLPGDKPPKPGSAQTREAARGPV